MGNKKRSRSQRGTRRAAGRKAAVDRIRARLGRKKPRRKPLSPDSPARHLPRGDSSARSRSAKSLLDHALDCRRRGWFVFPCYPGTKRPAGEIVPNGVKNSGFPLNLSYVKPRNPDAGSNPESVIYWFDPGTYRNDSDCREICYFTKHPNGYQRAGHPRQG